MSDGLIEPPVGGLCVGKPTVWWYPEFQRDMTNLQKRSILSIADHAKRICAKCSVVKRCLEYSLMYEPFGIWGGMDERERMLLAHARNLTPIRTRVGLKIGRTTGRPVGRPRKDTQPDVAAYG